MKHAAAQKLSTQTAAHASSTETMHGHAGTAALVLHVSWLAILLGLAIEIFLLAVSAAYGRVPKLNPLIADVAQRVAWSVIICASISVAMAASKMCASFMGLAGALSASVAFKIARAVQKGVGAALGVALLSPRGLRRWCWGAIKAVEYGCLAAIIAWIAKRKSVAPERMPRSG